MSARGKGELFVVPHPDDSEVMLGHRIASSLDDARVLVATDGTASTIDHIGDGFVASGRRREESYVALEYLGVSRDRQHYPSLPDGKLEDNIGRLRDELLEIMVEHAVKTVVTLGERGYDGHRDHISSHRAVVEAINALPADARPDLETLNDHHTGERVIKGHAQRKLGAIARHVSQFDITDPQFWTTYFSAYLPLMGDGETYDIVDTPVIDTIAV